MQQQQQPAQQCYRNNTNTPSTRLYAQLERPQQLVRLLQYQDQLQALLASGENRCLCRPNAINQHPESSIGSAKPHTGSSIATASHPIDWLHDRYPSTISAHKNKHHYEPLSYHHHHQGQQHLQDLEAHLCQNQTQQIQTQLLIPSVTPPTAASLSASSNSISSLLSSSNSPPTVSKSPAKAVTNPRFVAENPRSLPRISTMLRIPTPPDRQRNQSLSADCPLSVCSPSLKQKEDSSDVAMRSPYKVWTSASFVKPAPPSSYHADVPQNAVLAKTSRYLREIDRREILARIEQGETQADLAKEFQVSRAAICNLNKHREDVMRRRDNNPYSRHPKKSLKTKFSSSSLMAFNKNLLSMMLSNGNTNTNGRMSNHIHEVKSRATALLHTRLRNRSSTMNELQRYRERLVRLVLEEALALVPMETIGAQGVGWVHPPCAISIESHDQANNGSPMLHLFRTVEPDQPSARARVPKEMGQCCHNEGFDAVTKMQATNQHVNLVDTHLLPASFKDYNVFLLDVPVASANAICVVVQRLLERGAAEAMIYIVALFVKHETIASVREKHPSVKCVAAQISQCGET